MMWFYMYLMLTFSAFSTGKNELTLKNIIVSLITGLALLFLVFIYVEFLVYVAIALGSI